MDNAGHLTRHGNRWRAWFGDEYNDNEVIEAVHKNEIHSSGWHVYTPDQIQAAFEAASVLISHYGLQDVIGHDDIAPGRKSDPGPAFPMSNFRTRLIGRFDDEIRYETTTYLNIRVGPGTQHSTIIGSPLPTGTQVEILNRNGRWAFVDVLQVVNGIMDMQGWVHTNYLKRV